MKLHDQHVHSYYSVDSEQKLEGYLDLARKFGLSYFVTTEHLDLDYQKDGSDWTFDINKRKEELKNLQSKYPEIKMLEGIEIGYKNTTKDKSFEVLKNNKFDVVNLSVHEVDRLDLYHKEAFKKYGIEKILGIYYDSMLEAVEVYPDYDVLCHIDYGFKTAYILDSNQRLEMYEEKIAKILKVLIEKDKALEVNTKVQTFLPNEHTRYLLRLYKKLGGKNLTLSSDAHEAERYCDHFEEYMKIIKEEGFDHLCYFVGRQRFEFKL